MAEVKLLQQSQTMNALQEENSVLKRHIQVQQSNLNHYHRISPPQFEQKISSGGESPILMSSTTTSSSMLERLRLERLNACGETAATTQMIGGQSMHFIGDKQTY